MSNTFYKQEGDLDLQNRLLYISKRDEIVYEQILTKNCLSNLDIK